MSAPAATFVNAPSSQLRRISGRNLHRPSDQKPVTLGRGFFTDLVRADLFYWGELMGAALIASVPVAGAYNLFLDRFIAGITGRAVK